MQNAVWGQLMPNQAITIKLDTNSDGLRLSLSYSLWFFSIILSRSFFHDLSFLLFLSCSFFLALSFLLFLSCSFFHTFSLILPSSPGLSSILSPSPALSICVLPSDFRCIFNFCYSCCSLCCYCCSLFDVVVAFFVSVFICFVVRALNWRATSFSSEKNMFEWENFNTVTANRKHRTIV